MERKLLVDPQEEVKKLQDMVRNLELQNKQLRLQNTSKTDVKTSCTRLSENSVQDDLGLQCMDRNNILEMYNEECSDSERWLYTMSKNTVIGDTPTNLQKWLYQDVENNNEYAFQVMRKLPTQKMQEFDRGFTVQRNQILSSLRSNSNMYFDDHEHGLLSGIKRQSMVDTRTFTRPKKRMIRPSLETMVESPLTAESSRRLANLLRMPSSDISTIENTTIKLYHTFNTSTREFCSPDLAALTFLKEESKLMNSTLDKLTSDPKLNIRCEPMLSPDLNVSSQGRTTPAELNVTFLKTSCSTTSSSRDGGGRTTSCDSDDQMSTASDSSFSSGTRAMNNAGDVQNMARLQEESLRQIMSTPKVASKKDVQLLSTIIPDELPSPIPHSTDPNHGYHSDHSDQSSVDSRAKSSSRSSARSSPSGSPFGSTQVLASECVQLGGVPPLRDVQSAPAVGQVFREPEVPVRRMVEPSARGLRAPAVRSRGGGVTGLPRPAGPRVLSSIPRPPSRIPPPRIRSAGVCSARATNQASWMDGCY